jgi:hypothetical protein
MSPAESAAMSASLGAVFQMMLLCGLLIGVLVGWVARSFLTNWIDSRDSEEPPAGWIVRAHERALHRALELKNKGNQRGTA